jgi:phosphoribosylanthranilate isomerase
MNKIKLKICGMKDPGNIEEVIGMHPDYLGFIFYRGSPRYVGDTFSIPYLPDSIQRVGVFVNEEIENITDLAKRHDLDLVQLHGDESPKTCRTLKEKGLKVIKAFSVSNEINNGLLFEYKEHVDYFMFDTPGKQFGGTGQTFDWRILDQYNLAIPFFLSGGLNSGNVQDVNALLHLNIHALDVNSGVEHSPGNKDVGKIKEVIKTMATL